VRIDLRLVESQFRLVLFRFNLLFGKNLPEKFKDQFYGKTEPRHYQEKEPHSLRPHVLPGFMHHRVYMVGFRWIWKVG
jgi:hypothetical protein